MAKKAVMRMRRPGDGTGRSAQPAVAAWAVLLVGAAGCGADHAPICHMPMEAGYAIAYGPLSKDCTTGAGVELPMQVTFSAYDSIIRTVQDHMLTSDAAFVGCSAAISLDLRYVSGPAVGRYAIVMSSQKNELDVGGDGTLRGTVEITVGMTTADSVDHSTCTASGPVVLTPEPLADAGHMP